ncbi:hypothetical protein LWF01_11995 [Saxibacter everestensis]|uniref:Pilus assembly protein n=1 Tax=Saxibacter everestensis TaxID=2909229 RepID=A0ABY8QPE5_9MICO|nr:hypothetical protein LWF01_11995 [Brevibacteriaceae bacterium ZFBP1038]
MRPATEDAGSALIEFSAAGLILLVPLIYLIVALGQLQGASFAVSSAASGAARLLARSPNSAESHRAAEELVDLALRDYGLDQAPRTIRVSCSPACDSNDALVTVSVTAEVALPGVPAALDQQLPARVEIRDSHTDAVSRYG